MALPCSTEITFPRKSIDSHVSVFLRMSKNIHGFVILTFKSSSGLFSFIHSHSSEVDEEQFETV